jgi:hypothetical protein
LSCLFGYFLFCCSMKQHPDPRSRTITPRTCSGSMPLTHQTNHPALLVSRQSLPFNGLYMLISTLFRRGTCAANSGAPTTVESQSPNAQVVYSNIKFGPIGSTFNAPA